MTHIAHILERFTMPLEESAPGAEPWYIDWVIKNPKKISDSVTVGWYAYQSLLSVYDPEEISTAVEPFGGIGAQSLIIRDLFPSLRRHVVGEYTDLAVDHLRQVLPSLVQVIKADAYEGTSDFKNWDLVGLDFGDLTCWKTRPGQPHRGLLDRVFAGSPKAVVLTDVACPRLGLHRDRYEALLGTGTCKSYETYLPALAELLEEMYGYVTIAGFYHRGAAKMAMVPAAAGDRGVFVPVPSTPVGLDIL